MSPTLPGVCHLSRPLLVLALLAALLPACRGEVGSSSCIQISTDRGTRRSDGCTGKRLGALDPRRPTGGTVEIGCAQVESPADAGADHLDSIEDLRQNPPATLYGDRPATSGSHAPAWVLTGQYDDVIDERLLVHNLEHGYVVAYFDEGLDAQRREALQQLGAALVDEGSDKVIVVPFDSELPRRADVALLAWGYRQLCADLDLTAVREFVDQYMDGPAAPEPQAGPHLVPGEGMDPSEADGPLLLPPLGDAGGLDSPIV